MKIYGVDLVEEAARVLHADYDSEYGGSQPADFIPLAQLALTAAHVPELLAERDRLRKALNRIADLPSGGIPGHSVAVGCRHNIIAHKALMAPDEVECEACNGKGYTVDLGPWKTNSKFNTVDFEVYEERAEKSDPTALAYGRRFACLDCRNTGWIHV